MYKKRQSHNYLNPTKNWEIRSGTSSSPSKDFTISRKNLSSTEKLKTRVSVDYVTNQSVQEQNQDLNHLNQFDDCFQQTNEQPFLQLKIVHEGSPSADTAKSQRELNSATLIPNESNNCYQNITEDRVMPQSIHDQRESQRSSQYQFKTPKAGIDDNADFIGSCAKQLPVSKFDESKVEDRIKQKGAQNAFHNYKNSFQSFDNDLVYEQYKSMGITSNSNEKNKDVVYKTETNQVVNNSMFSPTAKAMEQTIYSSFNPDEQHIEPEMTQEDENQSLSLYLDHKQLVNKESLDNQNETQFQNNHTESSQYCNSVNKKQGSLISMGRQSNLVNNILSAGSYSKNKNNLSISKGRTPVHEKQFNTASRQSLKIQKFELNRMSNHKRGTTIQNSSNIEKVSNGINIYKSFQDKKKPMEPMIIQRSNNQININENYKNISVYKSSSRLTTKSNTRRTPKNENLKISMLKGPQISMQNLESEHQRSQHQTSQSSSFTGLTAEQLAKRRTSISKEKQQIQILAQRANPIRQNLGANNYLSVNSQKTTSRYNFSSNLKSQNNEVSIKNMKVNNRSSNLLKDMHSVRQGVKSKLNTGISDYVKQLKQNEKKIMDNVYQDASQSKHCKNLSRSSYKSCNSRSQSQESKYSRRSKRSGKNEQSTCKYKQDSQKTRLSQLKQKYNGLNRISGSRMSLNNLNNSVQSLHSQLSRANSQQVSKQDLEKYAPSRNEANSQNVSLQGKLQNIQRSFDISSQESNCKGKIIYQKSRDQSRHLNKSVNYSQSFKSIKTVHSQVQQLRNSISITGKNTKGTFEDHVKAEIKKKAEQVKIEKMKEAKKRANNYLRRGSSIKPKNEPINLCDTNSSIMKDNRSLQRVNQQKVIQDKLFDRYKIGKNCNYNKQTHQQQDLENEVITVEDVKTPERVRQNRKESITPEQKQSYQNFSKCVKFLNTQLGAVLQGYKVRRAYNNSQLIKTNRIKFRDLVQFVFFIQEEINDINNKLQVMGDDAILTSEHNFAKKYLGEALEEIISIRIRFQEEFFNLLQDNTWMKETAFQIQYMNYKQESNFDVLKKNYLEDIKNLLVNKQDQDAQLRLLQLNLAENKLNNSKKYRATQISTINDLNTMEEEDDDLFQEMERQLSQQLPIQSVQMKKVSILKDSKEATYNMSITENQDCRNSPDKTQLSNTLKQNLQSLQSDQKEQKKTKKTDDKNIESVSPSLSKYFTTKQTPQNLSPQIKGQQNEKECAQSPEVTKLYEQVDQQNDELEPEKQIPVKYCQKVQESKFQKQFSPSKRPVSSPQKVQKLIESMNSTPGKFESKIPRCSSNSNSKMPRCYREALSKSKIPRNRNSRANSQCSSNSKPRVQVPKLNLSMISQFQNGQSPVQVEAVKQEKHCKSVCIDLKSETSFEEKIANIKKQSMNIKKQVIQPVSFNCSANFQKSELQQVDEEVTPIQIKDISFQDYEMNSDSSRLINPIQIQSIESFPQESIVVDDIVLEQVEQMPKQEDQLRLTIFSAGTNQSSIIESSKNSTSTYQAQFNKRKNSKDKMAKSAKIKGFQSSIKKTEKKKISPMKENSPQKVSKFNSMNTISTENLNIRKQKSPKKNSPVKEDNHLSTNSLSMPVSGNLRRPRNQRSCDKSAQKPKVKSLEPFKDQTELCVNSPQISIPDQSENHSSQNVSKASQDQIFNQVNQIQQMIANLQKQKSESAASSNGQLFDEAYKQQFEQMINGLKTQFDALTK